MRSSWVVGLLVFLPFSSMAQNAVADFLGSPIVSKDYLVSELTTDFLRTHKFASPWVRELDFRLRSNDQEIGLEEYRMRLGLINPLEIKANKDYRKLVNEQAVFERHEAINEVLFRRYEQLVEHHYLTHRQLLIDNHLELLKKIKTLSSKAGASFGDMLDIEEASTKYEFEQLSVSRQLMAINDYISPAQEFIAWNNYDLVTKDQLRLLVDANMEAARGTKAQKAQLALSMKQQMLKIEKAEAFSNLGFIQGEYDMERGNEFEDHLGYQMGLTIPIFNTDKPKLERQQLKMLDDQADVELADQEETLELNKLQGTLDRLFEELDMIDNKIQSVSDLQKRSEGIGLSIKEQLDMAAYRLYLDQKKNATYHTLLRMYLQLLNYQEALANQPYVNYLSAGMETYELR